MAGSTNQLGIAVVGKDQLTPVMQRVEKSVEGIGRTIKRTEEHTSRLDKAFGSLGARIKTGIQMHVLNNALNMVERSIRRLIDVFPDLISRGEKWFNTVDSIVDITGMAAASASELAAVAENVGVSSDGLARMMNALGRAVKTNADEFRNYGIRIKDNKGHLLDSYQIFQNVRSRIAEMGPSLQSAALAQMAFGRASLQSADLLTLTNDEWERKARQARENGLIVGDAANAAVEAWGRAKSVMDQSITGIGTQILGAIAPTLVSLTNGITKVITGNMDNIVRFVAGAAVAISNIIGGLFGFEIDADATFGGSGATDQSKKLRDAIDEMNNANTSAGKVHKATGDAAKRSADDHRRLAQAVRDAKQALAAAKQDTPFHGNMSDADYILARQRHNAAVGQARDRLSDAQKALRDHGQAMREMTRVAGVENAKVRADFGKTYGGDGKKPPIIKGLEQTIRDAKTFGQEIADAIKDAIFGDDRSLLTPEGKVIELRSGGLVGALQKVQDALQTVYDAIGGAEGLVHWMKVGNDIFGKLMPLPQDVAAKLLEVGPKFAQAILDIGPKLADGIVTALRNALPGWLVGENPPSTETPPRTGSSSAPVGPWLAPIQYPELSNAWYWQKRLGFTGGANLGGGMGNLGGGMGGFGAGGWAGAGGNWLYQSPVALTRSVLGMTSLWQTIRDSLGDQGPLSSGLSDIQSALSGLVAALTGGGSGGDGNGGGSGNGGNGNANSLAGIKVRLKGVETVNRLQGRAIGEARALASVANTVNVVQAGNMREHERRINTQGKRIDKLWEEAIDHGWFSFGGPKLRGVRGSAGTMRLVLDAKETRRLFTRGVATTTLRPDN